MNNLYLMNKIKKYLDYVLIIDKNLNILEKYIGILLLQIKMINNKEIIYNKIII